jgi:predicted nucleic acid-binding protein
MDALLASIDRREVLVVDLDEEDYRRVRAHQRRYADLPLEFVDAAVVAIAERLEQTRIATLDRRHFGVVEPLHIPAFELVP